MTPEQKSLARHALGLPNRQRKSYRNRYFATKGGTVSKQWMAMAAAGEAEIIWDEEYSASFGLTLKGARLALDTRESLCLEDFPPTTEATP